MPPKAPASVADEKKMAMRRLAVCVEGGVRTDRRRRRKHEGVDPKLSVLGSGAVDAAGLTFVALVPTNEVVANTGEQRTLGETEAESRGDQASKRGAKTHESHDDTL